MRSLKRSIPPASPHRAGHYSGIHPEDQPYQSAYIPAQKVPVRQSQPRSVVQHEPESIVLLTVKTISRPEPEADHRAALAPRFIFPAPKQPEKSVLRGRFVPAAFTISCLILLVASSMVAFAFINKKPVLVKQVLNVQPNLLRVTDTFTLLGSGFGINDLISFSHDKDNQPLLDGNGKTLQTRADDRGTFSVQAVVPANWQVGQHSIYAVDIGNEQSISVVATLTVEKSSLAPPLLQLSSQGINLGTNAPGAIAKQYFMLINAGGRLLNWQASSDQSWLTVSPNSGTFHGRAIVQITANCGALMPQLYRGQIKFRQKGSNQPLILAVTMRVKPAPPASLSVSTAALTFSGTPNQNPGDQTMTLQNNGSRPLDWSSDIGNSASWLSINPARDHLRAHAIETVTVSVQSLQMAVGWYQGTITFKGGVNPQITVSLNVVAPGNLVVSPSSLNFSSIGQNPVNETIAIQNSGGELLNWTVAAATADKANWLNTTPSSGSLSPNETANVAIGVNAAALKPGSYQGMLTFTDGNVTSQVAVSLTVDVPPAPAITLNQQILNFSTLKGTNPAPQSFTITNTGTAALNWSIAEDQNGATFANVSPRSGSLAPRMSAVITVTPNVAQAAAGTLTTNITVSDSAGRTKVPNQRVSVNIVLKDQAIITLTPDVMTVQHDSGVTYSSATLDIANTGTKTLNWMVNSSASWLSVDTTSGSLNPGSDIVINVQCDSSTLVPGTYTANLTVSDSDTGSPVTAQRVTVTLVVK